MWKLILLCALIPPVLAVALRKWFCDRVLRELGDRSTNQTGARLAEHLLRHFELEEVAELTQGRRTGIEEGKTTRVRLSKNDWESRELVTLGAVALLVGRVAMARDHGDLWSWREWAVRFGWAFPAFSLVVVVFAVAVAKLTVFIGIVVVVATIGLAAALLLATQQVELESAKRVAHLLERTHALPREADAREVARCCQALAWSRVVPGVLDWVVGKPGNIPRNSLATKDE